MASLADLRIVDWAGQPRQGGWHIVFLARAGCVGPDAAQRMEINRWLAARLFSRDDSLVRKKHGHNRLADTIDKQPRFVAD